MNKKIGFTLIEVLAVIAIMSLLIIIAVPNILKIFENGKKNLFVSQAKNIYKEAIQEYAVNEEEYNLINRFYYSQGASENPLSLSGSKDVYYDIEIYSGEMTKFIVWNDSYIIELEFSDIKQKDIDVNVVEENS